MRTTRKLDKYKQTTETSESLIIDHYGDVAKIARKVLHMTRIAVDINDLISAGMEGLVVAARGFDPSLGTKFQSYASQRIRGAMLDELRSRDLLPRNKRDDLIRIENARTNLVHNQGKEPTDVNIANELGVSIEDLRKKYAFINSGKVYSLDKLSEDGLEFITQDDEDENKYKGLSIKRELIEHCINSLEDEYHKIILTLQLEENFDIQQIADVLGVTASRVSKLNGHAVEIVIDMIGKVMRHKKELLEENDQWECA